MSIERRPEIENVYRDIAATVDQETAFLSGGYWRSLGFQTLLEQGTPVLPLMLEQVSDPQTDFWWRSELICTIAQLEGKPVNFAPDDLGRVAKVRAVLLRWGFENEFLKSD